jgi:hypothetical protein
MKMGCFINPKINKAPRKTKGCRHYFKTFAWSFLWLEPINSKTGCYHYTSGKPEHSVKNNSIHLLNIKRKAPKAVRNQVNKLAYRAANIGSMLEIIYRLKHIIYKLLAILFETVISLTRSKGNQNFPFQ